MMKIKEEYIMKEVAGNNVVMATGNERMDFHGIMMFNEVGAQVFKMLDGTNSVESIISKIAKDYDVPYETVEADVNSVIEKMRAQGLLEE